MTFNRYQRGAISVALAALLFLLLCLAMSPGPALGETSADVEDTPCDNFEMNGLPNCDGSSDDLDCWASSLPGCDFLGGGTGDGGGGSEGGVDDTPPFLTCMGVVSKLEKDSAGTVIRTWLKGTDGTLEGTGDCPYTTRQTSAQFAMGRANCNKIGSHRMEFARTDADNSEGPVRAKCILLDSAGLAKSVVFKARITYNSTGGATISKF